MNIQDADVSAAAATARADLPISASGQEVGSGEHPEAQNHDRNESEGNSFDSKVGAGQLLYGLSNDIARPPALDSTRSKGKARNETGLEEPQQSVDSDDPANTQLVNLEGDYNEGKVDGFLSTTVQSTGQSSPPAMTPDQRRLAQIEKKAVYRTKQVADRQRANDSIGESSVLPSRRDPASRQTMLDRRQSDPGEPALASTALQASLPQRNLENASTFWENIETIRRGSIEDTNHRGESSAAPQESPIDEASRIVQKVRAKSDAPTRSVDGAGLSARPAYPDYLTPTPDDGSSPSTEGNSPLLSHISPSQIRHSDTRQTRAEVLVPRWQPDAEVTICPICGTQFSFFVRKHHCRKCGRVVCNSCSPHRITIPYQFIVQPPTEMDVLNAASSRSRPALNSARAGSFSEVETLGGGERVRLCNPCVPDPNTAPPQTTQFDNQNPPMQRSSHSRSVSTAARPSSNFSQGPTMTRSGSNRSPGDPQRRQLDSYQSASNAYATGSRVFAFSPQSNSTGTSSNNGSPFRGPRSRSSTIAGGMNDAADIGTLNRTPRVVTGLSQIANNPSLQSQYRPLIPRNEQSLQRPLPRLPRPPRIAEEDECPICHQELPSSALPDSESLRAAHINNCIESALRGTSSSPPPVPPTSTQAARARAPSASSSIPLPTPIANTPEARMAAREQAHAAVVLGHTSSPSPAFRRTGVFPYKATEKDCVDDAECTICLEEFEVGQDMGRLECFCRFHLPCIREWFVNHYGQCPVHHRPDY